MSGKFHRAVGRSRRHGCGTASRSTSPLGTRIAATLLGAALAFAAGGTLAVDDGFELDGNALEENDAFGLDDWETLFFTGGTATAYTGVIEDPAPQSIFDGGKKDIQDLDQWSFKNGSVPDKSDITNAYAASYINLNGDLVVYFGADRVINVGDTFLGFWFFQQEVQAVNGSFIGLHTPGDVLVLVNFPQANNAVPLVQVVAWDPTCNKAANNSPQPGQCAAKNLRLLAGASGAGAICGNGGLDDFCAITNEEDTFNAAPGPLSGAPWPYTAKDGTVGQFPFETFFEGGINLTEVIGGDTCFASFMAESRSSSSFTASLKDFAIGSFPVCSISVSKFCTAPELNATQDSIIYQIAGEVTNEGFGIVYDVNVTDNPAFDPGSLSFNGDPSQLAGGESIGYTATITVPLDQNGPSDTVTATANTSPLGTGTELEAMATANCPDLTINPLLDVTKDCVAQVTVLDNPVVVAAQVNVSGTVCNIGDSTVTDISVVDDKAGTLLAGVTLPPADIANPGAECVDYNGSYLPQTALDVNDNDTTDPGAVVFKDTVTATGTSLFGVEVTDFDSAMCPLCP